MIQSRDEQKLFVNQRPGKKYFPWEQSFCKSGKWMKILPMLWICNIHVIAVCLCERKPKSIKQDRNIYIHISKAEVDSKGFCCKI